MSEQEDFLVLLDEEGNEHKFEVVDFLQCNDNDYVILASLDEEEFEGEVEADFEEDDLEIEWEIEDETEENQEVVIFRVIDKGEEEQELVVVEDEEEWQNVAAAWEALE